MYSDLAIELFFMLRVVFKQALRQTQGLIRSIFKLMGIDIIAPHVTQRQWAELASQNSIRERQTRSTGCGQHRT